MSDKKSKGKDQSPSAPASGSGYTPLPVGPVPMTALQKTIEAEITKSWNNKPYAKFPIHKDIPRFIRSIMVLASSGECLYKPDTAEPQNLAVQRLISALANTLEPSNLERLIEPLKSLPEKVDTESMSQALYKMDDIENVTSVTMKLLKGLNQGILAPALVNLQLSFMNTKFMFADLTWNIMVQFFENHVRIEHRRYEGFVSGAGHFGWSSSLLIQRRDMTLLSVKTRICDFRIPDEIVSAEWLQLIKPVYEVDTAKSCAAIFSKPWDRLPIAKDLIRFATHTTFLIGLDSTRIHDLASDPVSHLKQLLLQICSIAKEEESMGKLIESTFDHHVSRTGDLNATLKSYLSDVLKWTDESVVARACKFFTQSILAPLATNLQLGLSGIVPIKDGATWTIAVSQIPEGLAIRHTKQQMSMDRTTPEKAFDCVWQCEFEVNPTFSEILQVRGRVVSLTFPFEAQLAPQRATELRNELTSLINVNLL